MSKPLQVTAEIDGEEYSLHLTAWGIYRAVHEFRHGAEEELREILERVQSNGQAKKREVTAGDVFEMQFEETWFGLLGATDENGKPLYSMSLQDFLINVVSGDVLGMQRAWIKMKTFQGDMIDSTETEEDEPDSDPAEDKKKHKPKAYSTESVS